MSKESLNFLLRFNRFNKKFDIASPFIEYFYASVPHEHLMDFAINSLTHEPLIMFDNRIILVHLLYFIMTKVGEKLPINTQRRLIVLLAQSNERNNIGLAHKNKVQALVLRWQRKNKTNYP